MEKRGDEAILEAAEVEFAARGFHGASIQAIAKRAGVSKAAVFHHFPSKLALYRAVVERACSDVRAMLLQAEEDAAEPMQLFLRFFRAQREAMQAHPNVARIVLRELLDGNEAIARDLVESFFDEEFSALKQLLQRAQQQGAIAKGCDLAAATLAASMINSFVFLAWPALAALQARPFTDANDAAERLLALVLSGIAARRD